jgi:hypothetical protein
MPAEAQAATAELTRQGEAIESEWNSQEHNWRPKRDAEETETMG